jgi:hypothetical protein
LRLRSFLLRRDRVLGFGVAEGSVDKDPFGHGGFHGGGGSRSSGGFGRNVAQSIEVTILKYFFN